MKTISERADEFAEREYIVNRYEKERISFGYFHGAIEQQNIDIDKACVLLMQELRQIEELFDNQKLLLCVEHRVSEFRKAMTE